MKSLFLVSIIFLSGCQLSVGLSRQHLDMQSLQRVRATISAPPELAAYGVQDIEADLTFPDAQTDVGRVSISLERKIVGDLNGFISYEALSAKDSAAGIGLIYRIGKP